MNFIQIYECFNNFVLKRPIKNNNEDLTQKNKNEDIIYIYRGNLEFVILLNLDHRPVVKSSIHKR